MPKVHGFFLDDGQLIKGIGPTEEMRANYASGFRPNVTLRDITIEVYGNTAAVASYVDGTVMTTKKKQYTGPWRFTETLVRDGGRWKAIQWHFSRLAPQT